MTRARAHVACTVGVMAVALAAYLGCINAGYVYDDFEFVVENPRIRSLHGIASAFWRRDFFSASAKFNIYRPFAAASFALDFHLWDLRPGVLHLENALLHALNAALVLGLCARLGAGPVVSLAAASMFAAHPIQTEAIAWVSGRSNGLFVLFALLSLRCYASRRAAASLALFAAALLSKEMAISLPLLLCAYEWCMRPKRKDGAPWARIVPFFVVAGLYVAGRAWVLGRVTQRGYWGGGPWPTALTMTRVFADYARLALFPIGQKLFHPVDISSSWRDPRVLVSTTIILAVVALAVTGSRRRPFVAFGALWFFIALAPVSNTVPLRALEAERFLYWPALGACMVMAWPARRCRRRAGIVAGLCACLAALTITRVHDWQSGHTIWRATIRGAPHCTAALNGLGNAYSSMGCLKRAVAAYRAALRIEPDFEFAQVNLGDTYREMGGLADAEAHYRRAMLDHPQSATPLVRLSHVARQRGGLDAAEEWLRKAIKLRPDLADAHNNLGSLLMMRKDLAGARKEIETALSLRPDSPEAHYNYALILRSEGRQPEAARHLREAERWGRGRLRR